ncbi:MAG TPA: ProQ/FINO family protein [Acetobacteraceae bacterium]|nr:ProQ/FINO family protein [Acetobacteraceae bacterium]
MVETRAAGRSGGQAGVYHAWPPAAAALIADWRTRWPAAFTKPAPLAAGFSGQIKAAVRADGKPVDRKMLSLAIYLWTHQSAYLRAVARGEMRRNLDGSDANIPDDAARQEAQKLLDARAAKHAERARREQERKLAAPQAA